METHALVLREFEFDARKPHLNARGEDHLLAISSVLSESELAVWVEPLTEVDASIDAVELTALNDARRQGVVQQLLARGIVDAEQRVQVGLPDSP